MCYLDIILIYGVNTEDKHQAIADKILQQCMKHILAVKQHKSELHFHDTIFLESVINGLKVTMDLAKSTTINKWPTPTTKKPVQGFRNVANYLYGFIVNYRTIAQLLIEWK